MTDQPKQRHQMRLLAGVLVALWAATAVAIAVAYRPGGPVDIVVVLACFPPVLVAAAGLAWPPETTSRKHRTALVWIWIAAILLAIPVLYGVASTLAAGGPQILVPSAEAAYSGLLALLSMSVFSVAGFIHRRRAVVVFERAATWSTVGLSLLLTFFIAAAFGLVALINDQSLRRDEPLFSRYGPTDPDLVPPLCHEPISLGRDAVISIEARSSEDNVQRGRALLEGRRGGQDEVWGGSWDGPDGAGRVAYFRAGPRAWLNDTSDDPEAPGTTWRPVVPGLFSMAGAGQLTMDGPPRSIVAVPRGDIVTEDLGIEVAEGARARHCRTFIDGPTAMRSFLPLRWLVDDDPVGGDSTLRDWRGQLDWWVFGDGELGRAEVQVSGRRSETGWQSDGVRAVLEAELVALHRDRSVDVSAPVAPAPSTTPSAALESAAP